MKDLMGCKKIGDKIFGMEIIGFNETSIFLSSENVKIAKYRFQRVQNGQ